MFVKICGVKDAETALFAVECGADAIGLVFHKKSPRYVEPGKAREIAGKVKGKALVVGVFKEPEEIFPEALEFCDLVQVYQPVPRLAERLILGVRGYTSHEARYYLIDASMGKGVFRGFPSDLYGLPRDRVILSGGLNPGNVSRVVERYRPFGVDTSSGVEESPGVKSKRLIEEFIRKAKEACR